uniref:Uncharacterized protein n=1 Tax=Apteryx owenii TaxID=8824 RepID=A0A8B9QBZ9_APTOW
TGFESIKMLKNISDKHLKISQFDFFMNLVIDECRRMVPGGKQNNKVENKLGNIIITLEILGKVQNQ